MASSLAAGLAGLRGRVADDALVVVSARCDPFPPARLLDVPDDRLPAHVAPHTASSWDGRDLGDPADDELVVTRGEVCRIEAIGAARVAAIRRAADAVSRCAVRAGEVPRPLRWFGGFSFGAVGVTDPFAAFGEAAFAVPRWLLRHRRDGAVVEVAVRGREIGGRELEAEAASVLGCLERGGPAASPPPHAEATELAELDEGRDRAAYEALVEAALGHIARGAFRKVVAARSRLVHLDHAPRASEVLARLRRHQSGAVRFAFRRGSQTFVGASPERLVIRADDRACADALAGSIPRGPGAKARLLASDKDRREHDLVVRAIADDLAAHGGRVDHATAPSLRVLRDVIHLWTSVEAAGTKADALELVDTLHPTPAMCGWPREPARAFIATHEPDARGWYSAPVGWFDASGDGAFAVAIRCALLDGASARLFGGAGIVEGSDPRREYDETQVKLQAMRRALGVDRPSAPLRRAG